MTTDLITKTDFIFIDIYETDRETESN